METRKVSISKASPLPLDYLRMVDEVFRAHFAEGLKAYSQFLANPHFDIRGEIGSNEVILAASLVAENQLSAVTAYGSVDFEPKASLPTVQDILAACVDAIGTVFESLISDPDKPELIQRLAEGELMVLDNAPLEWTQVKALDQKVFVKVDTAHLGLDAAADEWLKRHDPERQKAVEEEEAEVKKLFVTGKPDRTNH